MVDGGGACKGDEYIGVEYTEEKRERRIGGKVKKRLRGMRKDVQMRERKRERNRKDRREHRLGLHFLTRRENRC